MAPSLTDPRETAPGVHVAELHVAPATGGHCPFRAALVTVAPGCETRPDRHAVREVWIVVAGKGRLASGPTSLPLTPGRAVAFGPQVPHRAINRGALPLVLVSLWWEDPR